MNVGNSIVIEDTDSASPYILSIYAKASNTEYIATYIISWASVYAADITKLSEYNYTNNITIEVYRDGNGKFKIKYKSGNISSLSINYSLRKLIL